MERTPGLTKIDLRWIAIAAILALPVRYLGKMDAPAAVWLSQIAFQLVLASLAVALAGGWAGRATWERLGWGVSRLTFGGQVRAVLVCVVLIVAISFLFLGESGDLPPPPFHSALMSMIALFVSLVVFPAIIEETLFRGSLQRLLLRYSNAPTAILGSSILFAALHVNGGSTQAAFALAMGLCLGALCHSAGSVREAVLIHGLNNAAFVVNHSL